MRFLRLDRHGGDRAGHQTTQTNRLTGHFAIAVFAFLKTAQRRIDLGDKLALTIAGAQFKRMLFRYRGAVCRVWYQYGFTKMLGGFVGVLQ